MGQTRQYNLKRWMGWEQPERAEVNGVVGDISAALAGLEQEKASVIFGSFVGDGQAERSIDLGAALKWVLLFPADGDPSKTYGGLAGVNFPVQINTHTNTLSILGSTITVYCNSSTGPRTNIINEIYRYIAAI